MLDDQDPPPPQPFDLTPEAEALLLECGRLSLARWFDERPLRGGQAKLTE